MGQAVEFTLNTGQVISAAMTYSTFVSITSHMEAVLTLDTTYYGDVANLLYFVCNQYGFVRDLENEEYVLNAWMD